MKLYFCIILFALSLVACKKDSNNDTGAYAFIGGEIINANNNFVVLSKSDCVLDTIMLDGNNRFLYKIKNLQAGLYTFRHGSEIQMVLLEPKDSIIFRLNTFDFDESLVYTGEGAKKNNYLINEFLQNEIDEKEIYKLCQLQPDVFEKQMKLIQSIKTKQLKNFKNKNSTSSLFNEIAQANIDYNFYSSKEVYPIINYDNDKRNILNSLPKDFYSYRKDIDYSNELFKDYLNYNSFLRYSFNNLALKKHFEHSPETHFNNTSLCYNLDRINVIDSLINNPSIKNNLLYYFTINFLTKNKILEDNNAILKSFLTKSTDKKNNEIISSLAEALNNLKPGGNFPNIKVVDFENVELNFNSLISRPTVIFFWSHTFYEHFKESHYKVFELKNKYPEVDFIAINIDSYDFKTCTNSLRRNRFSLKNEYQFKNPEESMHLLAIYPMTKVIIIDKDNKIVNSNANMFASNFEEQLLGLINR